MDIKENESEGNLIKVGDIEDIISYVHDTDIPPSGDYGYGLRQSIIIIANAVNYIENKMNQEGWKQGYTTGVDEIANGEFRKNETFNT